MKRNTSKDIRYTMFTYWQYKHYSLPYRFSNKQGWFLTDNGTWFSSEFNQPQEEIMTQLL